MDRAFRASKRGAAAAETTPKKRKRSPSLPGTPGQADEPAAPPAEDLSPPRKKQLFANAVQLSRCVKVRACARARPPPAAAIGPATRGAPGGTR